LRRGEGRVAGAVIADNAVQSSPVHSFLSSSKKLLESILSYPILSYPIPLYQSYSILFYPILSYPILSYPILSHSINPTLFCSDLFYSMFLFTPLLFSSLLLPALQLRYSLQGQQQGPQLKTVRFALSGGEREGKKCIVSKTQDMVR
jgi:hypothetical protein